MMRRYMLDTNVVSYFLDNRPPAVRSHMNLVGLDATVISTITEAELRYGLANKPGAVSQTTAVERFLGNVTILAWDSGRLAHMGCFVRSKGGKAGSWRLKI